MCDPSTPSHEFLSGAFSILTKKVMKLTDQLAETEKRNAKLEAVLDSSLSISITVPNVERS